jgi:hypothetical protein
MIGEGSHVEGIVAGRPTHPGDFGLQQGQIDTETGEQEGAANKDEAGGGGNGDDAEVSEEVEEEDVDYLVSTIESTDDTLSW